MDIYWQVVMAYTKDENGQYTVPVRYMLCSTGSPKLGNTRIGTFKLKECRLRFGTFAGGDYSAQYWTLIVSRTYFHSVVYRGGKGGKKDLNSLYVDKYLKLGSAGSGITAATAPRWRSGRAARTTRPPRPSGSS